MQIGTLWSGGTLKYVKFRHGSGCVVGVIDGDDVRPLLMEQRLVSDLVDVIAAKAPWTSAEPVRMDMVELVAPISPERGVICVGKNYREHAEEFSRSGYDATDIGPGADSVDEPPVLFLKPPTAVVGPGAAIQPHVGVTEALDYEAELGVVIGAGGSGISAADAWDHVWGYTIINDVTARDLQRRHKQWFLGKSLDTFAPLGPAVVTADEVDGRELDVRCWVNDELRQKANTAQLIHGIPELVECVSAGMRLRPGDVIATGTPAGVGIGFDPPKFLRPGDEIRIEIQGVGVLINTVASEGSTA